MFELVIIDGHGVSYIGQLSFQFACYAVGIVFLYYVAIKWSTDSNYFHEDKVIVPEHVKQEAQILGNDVQEEQRDGDVVATSEVATKT